MASSEVYNIDCMELMARYPDKHFDLAVVDPPYGIDKDLKRSIINCAPFQKKYAKKRFDLYNKPKSNYFNELFRVSKKQIIWGGNYFADLLPITGNYICWDKGVPEDVTFRKFELAWSSFVCELIKIKHSGFNHADGRGYENIHPTQKPVKLYDWIFKNYATEGQTILDTHLGSGSSRIAAYKNKLNFVGCEIDKEYFDAADRRFKEFTAQLTLF